MIRKKKDEIEWLEFNFFAEIPGLVHGVFLRHGGISQGPYCSLNIGGGTGDDTSNVAENRRRLLETLDVQGCVSGRQVHSDQIVCVKDMNIDIGDCDGLITNQKNIALMIKHADCQAAIFYDPIKQVIANIHAGWRGQVKNIYRATVHKMMKDFGSKPENLLIGISPSLGPNHAEFINYEVEFPEEFWRFQVRSTYFDLWAIARDQLENAGVLPHHIEIAGICTHSHVEDYFSFRRDKVTGRNATMIALSTGK